MNAHVLKASRYRFDEQDVISGDHFHGLSSQQ